MSCDKYINPTHRDEHHGAVPWYGFFGLFYVPVGLASSNILMRKMKGLHFITIALYKYVILIPTLYLIFLIIVPFDFSVIAGFTILDWFLISFAAICQQSSQTFRFLAFKREKPALIVHYQYLNSFYALLFDLFIFHAKFHIYSIIGLSIMLSGYFIKFVYQVYQVN